jgi:hypothetical protein
MRFTWQVGVIIGICLVALALPLAGVILTLHNLTRGGAPQAQEAPESSVSGALENVLEGIADKRLAPGELESEGMKIELGAVDVREERARVERLLKSVGGIAIPTAETESEIRLLVRVPKDRLGEFLTACMGEGAAPPAGDLLEIVIKKRKTP